ncbi:MAG: winged helix-turn-helix transcriptional regulator [Oscillospiraceae bacterium]|nr:winged helix-turn-helix transcriptional regulator [Oscillospiraceae bacterium]
MKISERGCSMEEELYIDSEEFQLDEDELIEMAELFKMFGDSTRIKILCGLFEGEKCVQEITEATGSSQSAVSHQLRLLKQARLVRSRRNGKQVCYTLADDHVKTILGMAKEHLEE